MDDFIQMGERDIWGGQRRPFGLSLASRQQHLHVIGGSGTGKSTLLLSMFEQDVRLGRGCSIIDPHGDLASRALSLVPRERVNDVVYFAPADLEHPIGFNLLANVPADRRHLVTDAIVSAFQSIWRDSWGPRLQYILSNAIAALTECENVTLLSVQRMLVDGRYRDWVTRQVTDPIVRRYWLIEFATMDSRLRSEAISPILNKVGSLLLSGPLRNVLGQVSTRLDIPFIMDRNKILVADISKGRLGEAASGLIGALLVSSFYTASLWRADQPEADRAPHALLVDEFQNFAGTNFADILSESRKFKLSIALFHQHLEQIAPEVRDAVAANAANTIAFRTSEKNAETLSRQCGGFYPPSTFSGLPNHTVVARLLDGGEHLDPFIGHTLPPPVGADRVKERIIRYCRQRYSTPRAGVEDRLRQWMA
ncbi:MAG: TraM recognition domain-containing protein [Planctomycetia bacterium]|nr:TraM recognition domain-containing protein [Planctomycetia bacterium]